MSEIKKVTPKERSTSIIEYLHLSGITDESIINSHRKPWKEEASNYLETQIKEAIIEADNAWRECIAQYSDLVLNTLDHNSSKIARSILENRWCINPKHTIIDIDIAMATNQIEIVFKE